jgi:ELWxxDGT repeat protein
MKNYYEKKSQFRKQSIDKLILGIVRQPKIFLAILLLILINPLIAQPVRITDLSPTSGNGVYNVDGQLVSFNSKLYFVGNDSQYGQELFVYDGTNPPVMVADINPGSGSSSPRQLIVLNNLLCFIASDGINYSQLYKYDGTNPPSRVTSFTTLSAFYTPGSKLTICNNVLYVFADDGTHGYELWKYDGVNPPSLVQDINVGSTNVLGMIGNSFMKAFNNVLYFNVNDGTLSGAISLWKYDGVNPPSLYSSIGANPYNYGLDNKTTVFQGLLYYNAFNGGLYNCDGVNSPTQVSTSPANNFIEYNSKLYYNSTDATYGSELWAYDGTSSPYLVADINPGASSSLATPFALFKNILYLYADNGVNGLELWRYDGINSPTMVSDINPGAYGSILSNTPPAIMNNVLYFIASTAAYGLEIWKYDALALPSIAFDLNPGTGDGVNPTYPLFVFNNKLFFNGDDGITGWQLWEYDGSSSTTTEILKGSQTKDIVLYPNPSQGCFEILCEDNVQEIILSNSLGQREVFYSKKICSKLTGIVVVQIKTDTNTNTGKVFISSE